MKKTLLTLVALLLSVAMCFSIVGCDKDDDDKKDKKSSRTPEEIAGLALKYTYKDRDINKYLDLIHEDVVNKTADDKGLTVDEFAEEMEESMVEAFDSLESMGAEIDVDYEVGDVKECDTEDDIIKQYKDEYDLDVDEVKAVEVDITVTVSYQGESQENEQTEEMEICKIDGVWYFCPGKSFGSNIE